MGIILIGVGLVMFVPSLALIHIFSIPELWNEVARTTGWSFIMLGWAFVSATVIAIVMAYGVEIIWYHDKNDPES